MSKPNKENIRAWVQALRSGDFTQGRNRLRTEDKFCCLGVACELHRKLRPGGAWLENGHGVLTYLGGDSIMPSQVVAWLGLEKGNDNPIMQGKQSLAEYNDQGATFPEIADLIEREWLTEVPE
jgi:hypothetical protein